MMDENKPMITGCGCQKDPANTVPAFTPEQIAQVVYSANEAYRRILGEQPRGDWEDAPAELKESLIRAVEVAARREPFSGRNYRESHNAWVYARLLEGWKYGPAEDREAKTHPNMIPYESLPAGQKAKDALFVQIVDAMMDIWIEVPPVPASSGVEAMLGAEKK